MNLAPTRIVPYLLCSILLSMLLHESLTLPISSTAQRLPTLRKFKPSMPFTAEGATARNRVETMNKQAKDGTLFTDEEIIDICNSLKNLAPENSPINFDELTTVLKSAAHLSHKDWHVTSTNSDKLSSALSTTTDEGADGLPNHAKQVLERVLVEGNWKGAEENSSTDGSRKPWAVLVTGVNGIRKTTSIYQPWFGELLSEALCPPPGEEKTIETIDLPTGQNSFFRQLDHMICTLLNEEFGKMYAWAASELESDNAEPSDQLVQAYSDYKAAIFSRYRTLSELLGGLLLKEAQKFSLNCMMETSGKDVAMFTYVDHFFDQTKYNKLALHFTINDLECAKQSVDQRMTKEIIDGAKAIESEDAFEIVYANAGGPYGSTVLEGVQKDSDRVWESEVMSGKVGKDWYKATIAINAHPSEPWTAQAVKPDGSLGKKFTFERR